MGEIKVIQFDVKRAPELRAALEAAGFELRSAPHAIFGARGEGVAITLYRTGRLVVQGKEVSQRLERFLAADATESSPVATEIGDDPLIGTDESGKGDYVGPLVVAAVRATPEESRLLTRMGAADSKILSDAAVRNLDDEIRGLLPYSVVALDPPEYNARHAEWKNLNVLLGWAHARAIAELLERASCDHVLTDQFGDPKYVANELKARGISLELEQRPRAEEVPAVAAASIVARAEFLRRLHLLSLEAGLPLPKGASESVEHAARRLVRSRGREYLGRVAKLHFKTTVRVAGLLG